MVLTRSSYKKLGEILISLEEVQELRKEKMAEGDNSARIDALEKQIETIGSTLTKLVGLIQEGNEKGESSSRSKKKPIESGGESELSGSDEEDETVKAAPHQGGKNSYQNLKIDFRVEISIYDGSVDVERLDDWIERMETYFTLYGYSSKEKIVFATLKLLGHALTWWKSYCKQEKKAVSWNKFNELLRKQFYPVGFLEERWYKWYGLRQRFNQTIQEYTTEFQQQAMVFNITTEEYSIFIKYMAGLNEYIRKEMKLFTVESMAK